MTPNATKPVRCLLIGTDRDAAARLTKCLSKRPGVELVSVTSRIAGAALLEQTDFSIVIADASLPGGGGLALLKRARQDESRECFLLGRRLPREQLLEAMRIGVRDVFEMPLDVNALAARIGESAERLQRRHGDQRRQDRLRALSTRIIRDRREIRRRVDVVCRDLVGAYRQLAEKVVAMDPPSLL